MLRPGLIIFDCDGVLVDSESLMNRLLSENLAQWGLSLSPADCLAEFKGGSMLDVAGFAANRGVTLPDGWAGNFYNDVYASFREEGVAVVDGIPDLLTALDAAKIPCCVASNGSEEKMSITLGQNGLWERFRTACFSAHTYGPRKPDPTIFLAAAKAFGVAIDNVLVIEDSVSGAKAAKAAGMACLGYAEDGDGADLAAEGATIIHDIDKVARMIGLAER